MKFEELQIYQGEVLNVLTNSYNKHRLVHAYLFEGEHGCGTIEMATYMAMMIMCQNENKPCMHCSSCERILAKSHLNVLFLSPDGDTIKKEQVAELVYEFSMGSLEDGGKIAIINDIDKMNSYSANALLKYLEEPIDNYYLFLLTTNATKVLDTIQSRCQLIHFKPISSKYVIHSLVDCGVTLDIAYVLSNVTTSLDEAKKEIELGNITNLLLLAKELISCENNKKDPYPVYFIKKDLILSLNKDYQKHFLDIMLLIYQEMYKKASHQSKGYFEDILKGYKSQDIEINKIIKKLDIINSYQERLNYNVNLDLFYTSMLVELNQF